MPQSSDPRLLSAEFYWREAAKYRKLAATLTTPALKTRMLDLAHEFEQRADAAEKAPEGGRK